MPLIEVLNSTRLQYEWLIAKKMIGGRRSGVSGQSSSAIIKIAVAGIAIGIAVMILSVAIVTGFQEQIRDKVIGFGSHLQISIYNPQNTLGVKPMPMAAPFLDEIRKEPEVRNVQAYAFKSGVITENEEIHGIVAKGIDQDFDWQFFEQNLTDGNRFHLPDSQTSDSIVISQLILDRMNLSLGDKMTIVFIQDERERKRRFIIGGVFDTGMEQFDGSIMLCDIRHVQKLNNWNENQVAGYEVILASFDDLGVLDEIIQEHISYEYNTLKITDQFMDIFGWLELQDINVIIILTLMVLVSVINMISALLVLILERTNMIGILKALGAYNSSISRIFLFNAAYLVVVGVVIGNIIGLGLGFAQQKWQLITLDKANYYVDHVPILFQWDTWMMINLGSIFFCILVLTIPSRLVSQIDPVKTIRFN